MIRLDASTVLLQWATGGLLFLVVTLRRRELGLGYAWLLRGIYVVLAAGAAAVGIALDPVPVRDGAALAVALATLGVLGVSVARRPSGVGATPPFADAPGVAIGMLGLVAASVANGGPLALTLVRTLVGAAFLGAVSDAMLLGHWYLVQPGLGRAPLNELVRAVAIVWPLEVAALVWPTGMLSVLSGAIDDGYGGVLGWFWAASAIATITLCGVTVAALRERGYSAVMAATGLLYLAILTAFSTDLVARAVLAG